MAVALIYLLVGALAGLAAGLFGVGGGLVIVPALIFCFTLQGFSPEYLTQLAIGTSLAAMIITSLSSVRAHRLNVQWRLFWLLSPGILLGAWLGVHVAGLLPGQYLQLVFGLFAVIVAVQIGCSAYPKPIRDVPMSAGVSIMGGGIGFISALLGIGGGTITVPYLTWRNIDMRHAIATSAACGLPIAMMGALFNGLIGAGREALPSFSTGFIYWPAFLGIVLTSTPFAIFGAMLAQHLPLLVLRRCFAVFLLVMGGQFVTSNLAVH